MRHVFFWLTFAALLSLFGSGVYYTMTVHAGTLALATLFALLGALSMHRIAPLVVSHLSPQKQALAITPSFHALALLLAGLIPLALFIVLAATSPITSATRSLWLLFSPLHILLLSIPFLCVLALARISIRFSALLGGLLVFATSALAALLFPLGFGFDPFLHRATLEHIITFGTITPKPFYYIGAYSLELFGVILLHIPLFSLDVFLAPVGLALLAWVALRSERFHPALLAFLPFSAFISTTPQAIGFLWVFATVLAVRLRLPFVYAVLFALAACAAHPLAGVPALILVTLTFFATHLKRPAPALSTLTLLGIFCIPLMFFAQNLLTGMNVGFSLAAFADISRIPALGFFSLLGNPLLDTVMLLGGNVFFLTIFLALIGFFARTPPLEQHETTPLLLASIVALGNFFVLSLGFDFPFLIAYERTDFALRLITIAWIFLLPLASDGIALLSQHIFAQQRDSLLYGTLLITLLFSAHVYTTYPRHDGYTRSAAFNATPADKEIVHRIAQDAGGTPYVVLSNQTLSGMAVQELGFFHYYPGDIFAYPLPTSGPLYALFLTMIEQTPTRDVAQQARDLTGATHVYFVVHAYWWEADDRIAEAKKITDDWFTSDDGTVTVFRF